MLEAKADSFLLCFQSGDSELLVWSDEHRKLMKLKTEKTEEHDEALTCCDSLKSKGIMITGDRSGTVKIWNAKK